MKIIIVGAGLAGLTCAKILTQQGHEATVFEASDGAGGRVRTDVLEGFLLDRGFQVYFTAYPVAKRHLNHEALNLRAFDPGAIVCRDQEKSTLSDPFGDPKALVPFLLSNVGSFSDTLRVWELVARTVPAGARAATELHGADTTSLEYLRRVGFSKKFVDPLFRPFYGGIFLDRSLTTSSRVLRFTFKMLATGKIAVPTRGMGEISKQLAVWLPLDAIRTNSPVGSLLREGERVEGVETDGEEHEADAVVVADGCADRGTTHRPGSPAEVGRAALHLLRRRWSSEREEDYAES